MWNSYSVDTGFSVLPILPSKDVAIGALECPRSISFGRDDDAGRATNLGAEAAIHDL